MAEKPPASKPVARGPEPESPKERPTRADLKARYSANEKGPAA